MNNEGWIKINRQIVNHWLWRDAEKLKWWFDLLFLAAYEDHKVLHDSHLFALKRGEMIASVSFLAERWKRSAPTIIKFLKLLEGECMIIRKTLYRQTPIITICNYDKYQLQVDTIVYPQVDTIVYTNKESKEYINNDNNACACAREEQNFISILLSDQSWKMSMSMKFGFDISQWLEKFKNDVDCRGIEHKDLTDAKRHFNDWLRIKLEIEEKNKKNGKGISDKRRSTEVSATATSEYTTTF